MVCASKSERRDASDNGGYRDDLLHTTLRAEEDSSRGIGASHFDFGQPTVFRPLALRSSKREGLRHKNLHRRGTDEPYEEWRLTPDACARDLVGRVTVGREPARSA